MVEITFGKIVAEIVFGLTRVREGIKISAAELLASVLEKEYSMSRKDKLPVQTFLSLFLIQCSWPACFYFVYFYCSNILKQSFGYSSEQVIHHNFILSLVQLASIIVLTHLSYYIYPMKIVKFKLIIFSLLTLACPILLNITRNPHELLIFQSLFMVLISCSVPAVPIFFRHFPVFKRFTYTGLSYALSRAIVYVITSFGFVYTTKYLGHWGILVILIPINLGFAFGFNHFETLERKVANNAS